MAQLEVGDLAIVVRCHCEGSKRWLGKIVTVLAISPPQETTCVCCWQSTGVDSIVKVNDKFGGHAARDLRRIPPLSESELLSDKHDIPVTKEPVYVKAS